MNLTRRGFLKSCLALAAAPAIVRAESIMRIWTPPQELWVPQPFDLADGELHTVRVVHRWHGGMVTQFYVDDQEVPGIVGCSIGGADNYNVGVKDGAPFINYPRPTVGQDRAFQTTLRMPKQDSLDLHGIQYEDMNGPFIYQPSEPWGICS